MYLKGYHGDTSATFLVGDNVDEKGKDLVECTRESLDMAIKLCGPNVPYKEIGRVIRFIQIHTFYFFFPNGICSEYAHKYGYSVSDELSGHGIGKEFHCHPLIYHHGK